MASSLHHEPQRPLIDPLQLEEAGRAFRHWLDRVLGHAPPDEATEIAWEDGEPHEERADIIPPAH